MTTPEFVIVGRIRRAHGVSGELVVEPLTDAPAEFFSIGRRLFAGTTDGDPAPSGELLIVRSARPFKGGMLVSFDEILDRTQAELWRDRYVLVRYEEIKPPGEGEVFIHDLPGMEVVHANGELVGRVLDVYELPQGLMLDVSWKSGSVMLPFGPAVVREVDSARRRIVVEPPEGLLE